jgi:hypothetical protein
MFSQSPGILSKMDLHLLQTRKSDKGGRSSTRDQGILIGIGVDRIKISVRSSFGSSERVDIGLK